MKNKSVKRELNPIQQSLFSKLNGIMRVDQRRLSARIHGIGKIKSQEAQQAVAAEIQLQIEQAQLRVENRKSAVKKTLHFFTALSSIMIYPLIVMVEQVCPCEHRIPLQNHQNDRLR